MNTDKTKKKLLFFPRLVNKSLLIKKSHKGNFRMELSGALLKKIFPEDYHDNNSCVMFSLESMTQSERARLVRLTNEKDGLGPLISDEDWLLGLKEPEKKEPKL